MPKARAVPQRVTGAGVPGQPGLGHLTTRSRTKVPRRSVVVLKSRSIIRWQAQSSLANTCAAVMTNERDAALFALAALLQYPGHACQPPAMHPRMFCCCSHLLERVL